MGNFLVTDLKVIDSPQAGIGVARCLKALGHKVYGIDDTPFVTTSDIFEKTFVMEEIRTLNFDSLINKLISLKDLYNIDYLIPCYDETAILFSYIKDKLDFIDIKLIATNLDSIKKLRKDNLSNIYNGGKFYFPKTKVINSVEEAKEFANTIGYPVLIKGLTKGAIITKNPEELENAIKRVCGLWNNNEIKCLVQKFIKGKLINPLVAYKNNGIVSYLEMEKISLDSNGATWFGKLTTEKQLFEDTSKFCADIKLNDSIIEIETVLAEDNKYYVYEVNYRPPAWIYASALNGQNFFELFLNPDKKTVFNSKEVYFGREGCDYIKSVEEISQYANLQFYSKGAAYKTTNQRYPSELLL